MEIKVGDYVRTKNGKIRTVKNTVAQYYITDRLNISDNNQFTKEDIVKHSKNIIDLLEVGDYVNGHLLVELSENVYNQKLVTTEVDGKDGAIRHHYLERGIKSIVTKEQFSSMEYKVEEDKQ